MSQAPPAAHPARGRPRFLGGSRRAAAALCRYGYTNYRRLTSDDSDEHVYQVPGGDESAVRFDPDELAWIADHRSDSSDPKLAEITADEAPFSTIVLMPPLEVRFSLLLPLGVPQRRYAMVWCGNPAHPGARLGRMATVLGHTGMPSASRRCSKTTAAGTRTTRCPACSRLSTTTPSRFTSPSSCPGVQSVAVVW